MTLMLHNRTLRHIAIAVVGGLLLGPTAYLLTSKMDTYTYLGPLGRGETFQDVGFDPWTGRPHGATYLVDTSFLGIDGGPPPRLVTDTAPPELVDRRAIPLPIGIPLSGLIVLAGLTYRARALSTSAA